MGLGAKGEGRGPTNSGKITKEFKGALREHDLRTVMGDDAGKQPGGYRKCFCMRQLWHG